MGLGSRLVPVDLVEPYPIRVVGILNYIKPHASRLVVYRTTGIIDDLLDELFLVLCLDLYRGNCDPNIFSCCIRRADLENSTLSSDE